MKARNMESLITLNMKQGTKKTQEVRPASHCALRIVWMISDLEKTPTARFVYTNPKVTHHINSKVYRLPASLQARIFR